MHMLLFKISKTKERGKMNAILYTTIFIIGTLFGSFYTLAVYRIPRKKDITHTHSFCPNCNHKLGFFELIPVLSYIFLGGKCKNCKQKIRPRYLILEILSGVTFLIFAYLFKIDANNLDVSLVIKFSFFALYLCAIFIIAGISKENKKIERSVLYYSLAVSLMYIIYLCIIEAASIYRYAMYLIAIIIILMVDLHLLTEKADNNNKIEILMLIILMSVFTGEFATIMTLITTIIWSATVEAEKYIKNFLNKRKKEKMIFLRNINIPFYLCVFNIVDTIFIYMMKSIVQFTAL